MMKQVICLRKAQSALRFRGGDPPDVKENEQWYEKFEESEQSW